MLVSALNTLRDHHHYQDNTDCVIIELKAQQLHLVRQQHIHISYPISSSRYGVGNEEGSFKTPTGVHRIADKIGANCQYAEILKARQATGEVAVISDDAQRAEKDTITTRILWLSGLEQGINKGHNAAGVCVDSYQRYIYIHGTPEQGLIGQPASIGCIRMKNQDVITLFTKVSVGTLVYIV